MTRTRRGLQTKSRQKLEFVRVQVLRCPDIQYLENTSFRRGSLSMVLKLLILPP